MINNTLNVIYIQTTITIRTSISAKNVRPSESSAKYLRSMSSGVSGVLATSIFCVARTKSRNAKTCARQAKSVNLMPSAHGKAGDWQNL